ncbi:hypothetical protein BDB01DRAFT_773941 [Pilobolus umbonatus]|nr:hypothetical protein BDB01DRAFT_773941 [Pilobolus umbonatus]
MAETKENETVFLDLTSSTEEELYFDWHELPSTHDGAEMVLYSFVDTTPDVADLIWSKQQLKQGEFLTLTDGQEDEEVPSVGYSTHEPNA